jgi:membrane-associated phospholipid phosphatase
MTVSAERMHFETRFISLRSRIGATVDASIGQLGRRVTAAVVVLAGGAVTIVVGWVLGRVAHSLETAVDWPIFRWFASRQVDEWSRIWLVITNMGAPRVTQGLAALGALVLAFLWYRRGLRWWVPLLVLPVGYAMEKYGQIILKLVVDRGHPPTTHGTWPSGGCARVFIVYGLIAVLFLMWRHPVGPRAWVAGASVVSFCVTVQAYARMYNQEHWFTDVAGGVVFGAMLLVTMTGAAFTLDRGVATAGEGRRPSARSGLRVDVPSGVGQ